MADKDYHIKIKVDADTSAAQAALNAIGGGSTGSSAGSVANSSASSATAALMSLASSGMRATASLQSFSTVAMRATASLISFSQTLGRTAATATNQNTAPATTALDAFRSKTIAASMSLDTLAKAAANATANATAQAPQGAGAFNSALVSMASNTMMAVNAMKVFVDSLKAGASRAGGGSGGGSTSAGSTNSIGGSGGSLLDTLNNALGGIMPGQGSGLASMFTGMAGNLVKSGTMLAGGIASAFGPVGVAVGSVIGILGTVTGGFLNAFGRLGDALLSIPGMLLGMAKNIAMAVGTAAAAFAGAVYAAHKILSPAAEDERYKLQLSQLGAAGKLGNYKQVAAEGPQSLGEVVRAGIQLESFGLNSDDWMKPIQDSASMFGTSMEELGGAIGRLKSGQSGEALEALRRVGVMRSDLESRGVKFDGGGALQSSIKDALAAVKATLQARSGGMAKTMSTGYEGAVSNLGDAIHTALSAAFEKAVPYASAAIRSVTDGISTIGDTFAQIDWRPAGEALNTVVDSAKAFVVGIDWAGWGNTMTGVFEKAANIANSLFSEEGRGKLAQGITDAWTTISGQLLPILETSWALLGATMKTAFIEGSAVIVKGMTSIVWDKDKGFFSNAKDYALGGVDMASSPLRAFMAPFAAFGSTFMGEKEDMTMGGYMGNIGKWWNATKASNIGNNGLDALAPKAQASPIDAAKADFAKLSGQLGTLVGDIRKAGEKIAPSTPESRIDLAQFKVDSSATDQLVKAAVDAAKGATTIKADPSNMSAYSAAVNAIAKDFATKKTDAVDAIANMEMEGQQQIFNAENAGVNPTTIDVMQGDLDKLILNLKGAVNNASTQVDSAKATADKALKDAQKDSQSYQAATNKILTKMLAELKSLNDYSMSDVADSVFA